MKRIIKITGVLTVVIVCSLLVLGQLFGALTAEEATDAIEKSLENFIEKNDLDNVILRIYSEDYQQAFAVGNAVVDSQYHSASVGKTITATLIYMLEERGKLKLEDSITNYLDEKLLKNLFLYKSEDCKEDVSVRMLLNHTSGIGDYFAGPVTNGDKMLELIERDPTRIWTPLDLVEFTRNQQESVGKPGERFYYSDTGYLLLGFIIEEVTGQTFFEALDQMILTPLNMQNTTMIFQPTEPVELLPVIINGVDFSQTNALSIDWSGGGLITTTQDLLVFYKALLQESLISESSLNRIRSFNNVYDKGIYYGEGMMQFNLGELSPLLKKMGKLYGGVGMTGSFMLTDETNDVFIIMNVGNSEFAEKGVEEIIKILMIYNRIE